MTNDPSSGRPARPDEVEPSDDMREADVANGEPGAATDDGNTDDATPGGSGDDDSAGGESGSR